MNERRNPHAARITVLLLFFSRRFPVHATSGTPSANLLRLSAASGVESRTVNWYLQGLRKYAVFSGRARRREFWMFELINSLITFGLFVIAVHLGKAGFWIPPRPAVFIRRGDRNTIFRQASPQAS